MLDNAKAQGVKQGQIEQLKEDIESYSEMEWNYEPARREYLEAPQEEVKESEK